MSVYLERRASDEDRLAEAAIHRGVREKHRQFAAAFRRELGRDQPGIRSAAELR